MIANFPVVAIVRLWSFYPVTDLALRLEPTVAELKHSFHLSFSISQLSFPISPALKPMSNGQWKMGNGKPLKKEV
jgi:hypothetical protein